MYKREFPQASRMMKRYKNDLPKFILSLEIQKSDFPTIEFTRELLEEIYLILQREILEAMETSAIFSLPSFVKWYSPWFEMRSGLYFYGFINTNGTNLSELDKATIVQETKLLVEEIFSSMKEEDPSIDHNFSILIGVNEIDFKFPSLISNPIRIGTLNEHVEKDELEKEEQKQEEPKQKEEEEPKQKQEEIKQEEQSKDKKKRKSRKV